MHFTILVALSTLALLTSACATKNMPSNETAVAKPTETRVPAGVTALNCSSANGRLQVVFEDDLVVKQYITVDQELIKVTRNGRPVKTTKGLSAYLNKGITSGVDFTIFEASDSYQDFHLVVKGSNYELSKLLERNKKVLVETGRIDCRLENP